MSAIGKPFEVTSTRALRVEREDNTCVESMKRLHEAKELK